MVSEMTPIAGIGEAFRNPTHGNVVHRFANRDLTRCPQLIHVISTEDQSFLAEV